VAGVDGLLGLPTSAGLAVARGSLRSSDCDPRWDHSIGHIRRKVQPGSPTQPRVRMIIFRVVATLAGLFFVAAVVLMASAPWVLLQADQNVRTELNRWFLTVAGSVDAIIAAVLLALAHPAALDAVAVELAGAVIVAGAAIFPFQPTFAAILAIGVVPLIAYQYWRDVRMLHMPMVAATLPAQWPGTLANPLSQEGEQQAVALGRTRIEGANMRTRTNLAHTRNTHAVGCRHRKVLETPLTLRGSAYPYSKGPAYAYRIAPSQCAVLASASVEGGRFLGGQVDAAGVGASESGPV